jgi:hypothetical protein
MSFSLLTAIALCVGAAFAAADAAAGGSERLEQHRAACLLSQPNANVEACVQERLAAAQAAREGELQDGATPYQRNALLRCRALPIGEQSACEARMRAGTTSGSVEEGGIIREWVVRDVPAPAATATPADPSMDTVPADPNRPHGPQLPR